MHTTAVLEDVPIRFNGLGMRGPEPPALVPGRRRLLCLGDSIVLGVGVEEQDTVTGQLARALTGDSVDVMEAAVAGWNTVEEAAFLGAHIDELAPDVVVLLYVSNDNEPMPPYEREARVPQGPWDSFRRWLVLRSRLFEWGWFVYDAHFVKHRLAPLAQWEEFRRSQGPPFAPTEPGWLQSREALGRIDAITRARGTTLLVFFYNMDDRPPNPEAVARLREWSAETQVPVFDTLPYFAGRDFYTLIRIPFVDPHPNAAGHALLAAGILRQLRAAGVLSGVPRA